MASRRKRLASAVIRLSICLLALAFVIRGVSWHDRAWVVEEGDPSQGSTLFKGTIAIDGDTLKLQLVDGTTRSLPLAAVAVDEKGERRLEYGIRSAWRNSDKWLVLAAIVATLPVGLLLGLRLHWLLKAQDVHIGVWDCIKLSFAGNFLNFAAPLGSNAGDLFKAYFVTLHTHRRMEAVTTIALDRILGLGTLVAVVAVITTLSPADSRLGAFRNHTLVMLALGVGAILVYVSPIARALVPRVLDRPPALFGYLRRIDAAAIQLLKSVWIMLGAVAVTLALQVLAIGAYVLVARAVALDLQWNRVPEFFAYFYMGAVIQALPGPPQGLGTVELAYRYFFAPYGSVSQILCMAFVIRLVVLICALPGALVAATGSYKPKELFLEDEGDSPGLPSRESFDVNAPART